MKMKKYNIVEKIAIYLAERSTEQSVPMFSYKVKRPNDLKKCLIKIK